MKNKLYEIYIDGISHGNPGPAGLGLLIVDPQGCDVVGISGFVGNVTSEQAGFRAFTRALKEVRKRKIPRARINSSNEMLVRQIQGIYKIIDPVVKQLKKSIYENFTDIKFEVRLISSNENKTAIFLAQEGLRRAQEQVGFGKSPFKDMTASIWVDENKKAIQDIQRSAGGIVYRKDGDKFKICMIAKKKRLIWALPKGRVAEGETPEQTAVREVGEETGHLARVEMKIDEVEYYFYWRDNNTFYHKFVYYFLMPLEKENARERDAEADAVLWFTPGEAHKIATYINEKEIIKKAWKIFEAMP